MEVKSVGIYVDKENNLLIIPSSPGNVGTVQEINIVHELKSPYNEEEFENVIKQALTECNTMKPDENLKITILENYLGIKGYLKAISDKKLVEVQWLTDQGFSVLPSIKKKGWFIQQRGIKLGDNPQKGEFFAAFEKVLKLCK